jgi:hypothetical protein
VVRACGAVSEAIGQGLTPGSVTLSVVREKMACETGLRTQCYGWLPPNPATPGKNRENNRGDSRVRYEEGRRRDKGDCQNECCQTGGSFPIMPLSRGPESPPNCETPGKAAIPRMRKSPKVQLTAGRP